MVDDQISSASNESELNNIHNIDDVDKIAISSNDEEINIEKSEEIDDKICIIN